MAYRYRNRLFPQNIYRPREVEEVVKEEKIIPSPFNPYSPLYEERYLPRYPQYQQRSQIVEDTLINRRKNLIDISEIVEDRLSTGNVLNTQYFIRPNGNIDVVISLEGIPRCNTPYYV